MYHHPGNIQLTSQARGVERDIIKNKLRHVNPYNYDTTCRNTASIPALLRGNLQNIKSGNVIRKIRSDAHGTND